MALTINDVSIFAEGVDHSECICVHPDGSVWAGGEAGQIYRISADGGEVKEINNTGGFVLGLAFSPDASWLAVCDLGKHCVWKLDIATNKLELFADGAEGEKFNIPNYPVFDSQGRLYVSESGAFRQVIGKVFRFEPDGTGRIWHNGPFNFANGMALSKNEDYLYVVCSFLPGIERIAINADGAAGEREVYITMPQTCPDGVALDEDENLYITCYTPNAIYKADNKRSIKMFIDDWEAHTLSNPTNIAFGGENFDQIFTSNLGRWHISKINAGVKGLKLVCHK
ncbi:SMP-30/gluconolactonase/LRE family protein [Mucilaginibacter limnophilus]|uniref:SMP-30/gluconolactonase/LRE family protein n=1 Tax=Mucilaginibacter limnophilus TaxID=1932778 RepID=A0A3S2Y4U0_9SPHI|nr:SMP-30/gluconolactonase/LRE family protein [Mucilaginibacter limnophilus]RVU02046.1 SMP-30/gluconolactonase/LRE family protein [Mucilaginibacter limnophilus]